LLTLFGWVVSWYPPSNCTSRGISALRQQLRGVTAPSHAPRTTVGSYVSTNRRIAVVCSVVLRLRVEIKRQPHVPNPSKEGCLVHIKLLRREHARAEDASEQARARKRARVSARVSGGAPAVRKMHMDQSTALQTALIGTCRRWGGSGGSATTGSAVVSTPKNRPSARHNSGEPAPQAQAFAPARTQSFHGRTCNH
jgi:hypothetical protein